MVRLFWLRLLNYSNRIKPEYLEISVTTEATMWSTGVAIGCTAWEANVAYMTGHSSRQAGCAPTYALWPRQSTDVMSSDSPECGQPEYSLEKVSAKRPGEQTLVGLTGCLTPEGCGPPEPSLGGWRRCWLVMLVHPALWPIPSRH